MAGYRLFGCILIITICLKEIVSKSLTTPEEVQGLDCSDIWSKNQSAGSGVYVIQPDGAGAAFPVFCDITESGGWTVVQHRNGLQGVLFNRTWSEYEEGFGFLTGEHWLGLQKMSALTHQSNRQCKLRISLEDFSSPPSNAYAQYDTFGIGSASELYRLSVANYSGTAGDAFQGNGLPESNQYGSAFSTVDVVNDNCALMCTIDDMLYLSCSSMVESGWWFNACGAANLNGHYLTPPDHSFGISSLSWPTWRPFDSLKTTKMSVQCS